MKGMLLHGLHSLHLAGIQIFYPGLAGRLLQTCCATKEPPHIIYCEEATDPIAAECWFQLQVQQVSGVLARRQHISIQRKA